MKKIIALLIIIASVLALCACDNGSDEPNPGDTLERMLSARYNTATTVTLTAPDGTVLNHSYTLEVADNGERTCSYYAEYLNVIDEGALTLPPESRICAYSGSVTTDASGNVIAATGDEHPYLNVATLTSPTFNVKGGTVMGITDNGDTITGNVMNVSLFLGINNQTNGNARLSVKYNGDSAKELKLDFSMPGGIYADMNQITVTVQFAERIG